MNDAKEHAVAIVAAGIAEGIKHAHLGPEDAQRAAVLGAAVEAAKRLSGPTLVWLMQSPADRGFAQEWTRGQAAEIEEKKQILESKIDQLLESAGGSPDTENNVLATFAAWSSARTKTADSKKARLLMAAFVNAFDSEAYQDGMNTTLLQTIGSLDYGDLYLLKALLPQGGGLNPSMAARFVEPNNTNGATPPGPGTLVYWHAERLQGAGLAWAHRNVDRSYNPVRILRTELGDRLLALIGGDAFREAELI